MGILTGVYVRIQALAMIFKGLRAALGLMGFRGLRVYLYLVMTCSFIGSTCSLGGRNFYIVGNWSHR